MTDLGSCITRIAKRLLKFKESTGASTAEITLTFSEDHPIYGHKITIKADDDPDPIDEE